MTLTNQILDELVDCAADPDGLEEVLRKYVRSKGPLYSALAQATSHIRKRLEDTSRHLLEAETRKDELYEEVGSLEELQRRLSGEVQELEEQAKGSETQLSDVCGLLDRADELAGLGFGEEQLRRLRELLANMAACQGAQGEEGIAQFFETVERYESVVSLDIEVKRSEARSETAKNEAERWDSQAKLREAKSKARTSAIDVVEKLMGQGVKGQDLSHWQKILQTAGTNPEELSKRLGKYGSLESLTANLEKQADELQLRISKLETQAAALIGQRDNAAAAVKVVKDSALSEVKQAGDFMVQEVAQATEQAKMQIESLTSAGFDYGDLREEAALLGEYVTVAKLLLANDRESWGGLGQGLIQHIIAGAALWAQAGNHDVDLPTPDFIFERTSIPRRTRLRLSEILIWAVGGVLTEQERMAFSISR